MNNQKAQIAGLYNTGFNNATNTALQSQGQQLQGASTLGSLTGAATGANQAGFNIGQTLWQDPLSWVTQGAGGLSPFLQGAGQNTTGSTSSNSTGTSTGQNYTNVDTNPSLAQDIFGVAGLGLGLGLFGPKKAADGGAIKGYDAGGAVSPDVPHMQPFTGSNLHTKFADAFKAIHEMKQHATGGGVKGYDWGGTVTPFVDPSNQFGMNLKGYGDVFTKYADNADHSQALAAANANAMGALNNQAQSLSAFMGQSQTKPLPAYDAGGSVDTIDPFSGTTDSPALMDHPLQAFDGGGAVAGWSPDGMPMFDTSSGGVLPSFLGKSPAWSSSGAAAQTMPAYSPAAAAASAPAQPESSTWGDILSGVKQSPIFSGNWTEGTGPASRALLAASGQHIGAPIAEQASRMVQEALEKKKHELAQKNADRLHEQWLATTTGRMPDGQMTLNAQQALGTIGGQKTLDAQRLDATLQSQAETARHNIEHEKLYGAQIQKSDPAWVTEQETKARYDSAVQYAGKDWANSEEGRQWVLGKKMMDPNKTPDQKLADVRAAARAKNEEKRLSGIYEKLNDSEDLQRQLEGVRELASGADPKTFGPVASSWINEALVRQGVGQPGSGDRQTQREILKSRLMQLDVFANTPRGQGAITENERAMIKQIGAKIDSNQPQAVALLDDLVKRVKTRIALEQEQAGRIADPAAPPQPGRLRLNPATGNLEPVQ